MPPREEIFEYINKDQALSNALESFTHAGQYFKTSNGYELIGDKWVKPEFRHKPMPSGFQGNIVSPDNSEFINYWNNLINNLLTGWSDYRNTSSSAISNALAGIEGLKQTNSNMQTLIDSLQSKINGFSFGSLPIGLIAIALILIFLIKR